MPDSIKPDKAGKTGVAAREWERHTAECPARAGSVYYCECGADPLRARGVDASVPGMNDPAAASQLLVDTGSYIHLPQTPRIKGRKTARSIHGYFGEVVTRKQVETRGRLACPKCFPEGLR